MITVRLHGRGGQGAQVACQILAEAVVRDITRPDHVLVLDATLLAMAND